MLSMLKVVLGYNTVSGGGRIPGKGKVFLADLVRSTADTYIRAVAIEDLHTMVIAAVTAVAAPIVIAAAVTVASSCSPVSHKLYPLFVLLFFYFRHTRTPYLIHRGLTSPG